MQAPAAFARTLASSHPEAMLPCPVCAASVRGRNLPGHLHDKHPDAALDGPPTWNGRDPRDVLWATVSFLFTAAMLGICVASKAPVATAFVGVLLVIGLVRLVLAALGKRVVTVAVDDFALTVRQRRRGPALEATLDAVEVGGLVRTRSSAGMSAYAADYPGLAGTEEERAGTYLRVGTGRASIVVGCPRSTNVRKHWTGWTATPKRTSCKVVLDPGSFVRLQYALVEKGVLSPR